METKLQQNTCVCMAKLENPGLQIKGSGPRGFCIVNQLSSSCEATSVYEVLVCGAVWEPVARARVGILILPLFPFIVVALSSFMRTVASARGNVSTKFSGVVVATPRIPRRRGETLSS